MLQTWADLVAGAGAFGMLTTVLAIVGALAAVLTVAVGYAARPYALRAAAVACLLLALATLGSALAGYSLGPRGALVIALWGATVPMLAGAVGLAVARSWRAPYERDALTPLGVVVGLCALLAWGFSLNASLFEPPPAPSAAAPPPSTVASAPKKTVKAKRKKVVKLDPQTPTGHPVVAEAPKPPTPEPTPPAVAPPVEAAPPPLPPPEPEPEPQPEPEPPADPHEPDWRNALAEVVRSKRGQLRACYEQELKKEPTLKGRVVVAFSVTPEGRIGELSIEENSMAHDAVGTCILARMKSWQFPFRPREELHAEFPFVFAPGK